MIKLTKLNLLDFNEIFDNSFFEGEIKHKSMEISCKNSNENIEKTKKIITNESIKKWLMEDIDTITKVSNVGTKLDYIRSFIENEYWNMIYERQAFAMLKMMSNNTDLICEDKDVTSRKPILIVTPSEELLKSLDNDKIKIIDDNLFEYNGIKGYHVKNPLVDKTYFIYDKIFNFHENIIKANHTNDATEYHVKKKWILHPIGYSRLEYPENEEFFKLEELTDVNQWEQIYHSDNIPISIFENFW